MADYTNLNSMRPSMDFSQSGLFGGLEYAKDRRQYEDLMKIFQSNQQIAQQENARKLESLLSTQGSADKATIAKNRAEAQWGPDRIRGLAQQQDALGQKGMGTLQQDIAAGISTGRETISKNEDLQYQRIQALINDAIAKLAVTPEGLPQTMLLSDPRLQAIPGMDLLMRDPSKAAQMLPVIKAVNQHRYQQSKEGMGKAADFEQTRYKEGEHNKRTADEIRGRQSVANTYDAGRRAMAAHADEAKKDLKKIEQDIMRLANLDAKGDLPEEGKKLLKFYMQREQFLRQSLFAAQSAYGNSFMGGQGGASPTPPRLPSEQGANAGGPVTHNGYTFPNQAALDAYKAAGGK